VRASSRERLLRVAAEITADEKATIAPNKARGTKDVKHTTEYGSWRNLQSQLHNIELRLDLIEGGLKKVLSEAETQVEQGGSPELVQKARNKFGRIFGSLLSPIEMVRSHVAPLRQQMSQIEGRLEEKALKFQRKRDELGKAMNAKKSGSRCSAKRTRCLLLRRRQSRFLSRFLKPSP
jgi:hypothetical protein